MKKEKQKKGKKKDVKEEERGKKKKEDNANSKETEQTGETIDEENKKIESGNQPEEEICEIFKLEKEGVEKTVRVCNTDAKSSKEGSKNQNKQLRNVLIGIGVVAVIFVLIIFTVNSIRHFEYRDVDWNVVKEGDLIFYNTVFPFYSSMTGAHIADYNIYLRNDPRDLNANVDFDGKFHMPKIMAISFPEEEKFVCEGKGAIAIANFVKIFGALGTEVVKDENAQCDELGRYMFVEIVEGEETRIEKNGPACYEISVKECEILEGTERFLLEAIVTLN